MVEIFDTGNDIAMPMPKRLAMTMRMGMDIIKVSISGEWDSGAGSDCSEGVSEVDGEEKEEEGRRKSRDVKGEEDVKRVRSRTSGEEEESDRRVIQPDICAISQLLNFDEVRWWQHLCLATFALNGLFCSKP